MNRLLIIAISGGLLGGLLALAPLGVAGDSPDSTTAPASRVSPGGGHRPLAVAARPPPAKTAVWRSFELGPAVFRVAFHTPSLLRAARSDHAARPARPHNAGASRNFRARRLVPCAVLARAPILGTDSRSLDGLADVDARSCARQTD